MIKRWFKKLLGITDLENQLFQQKKFNTQLQQDILQLQDEIAFFKKITNVGIDVHVSKHSRSGSWAVICLQGQNDYINFVDLREEDLNHIKGFLRQFERGNATIDSPIGMKKFFFEK